MNENFIHVCFIIDKSGSMYCSTKDVTSGFDKVIKEQKENNEGTCAISLFQFGSEVEKVYIGKDINEIEGIDYCAHGATSLYDGVGYAIDSIGKWIDAMDEDMKPEKNLIVIMTDGEENNSSDYTASQVKEMIKHQEEKYNWSFVYMGSDISKAKDASDLGISNRCFSSKSDLSDSYTFINHIVTNYRGEQGPAGAKGEALNDSLQSYCYTTTCNYAQTKNMNVNDLLD